MKSKDHKDIEEDISGLTPWRKRLHIVIFGYETLGGKLFDIGLLIAIFISIVVVMLESVKGIRAEYGVRLYYIEWVVTGLFTIEYVARILASPSPRKYMFSFMGIIDLLSILPTYLSILITGSSALIIIRSIRLIRVFRVLKLTQFVGGADHLKQALYQSRHKVVVFLVTVLCVVFISGTLLYLIEGEASGFTSIPKSIYWAIVTLTTVGYGDIAPQTLLGQTFASMLMILGYAIIAVPTGIVTSEMMNSKKKMYPETCSRCSTPLPVESNYCLKCGEKQA